MQDYDNLQNFLEHVALATSIDQDKEGAKVNLMTMHAAKGLGLTLFSSWLGRGFVSTSKIFGGKRRLYLEGKEVGLRWVLEQKRGIFIFCNEKAFHGDWMDTLYQD